jgi:hypothetical protein
MIRAGQTHQIAAEQLKQVWANKFGCVSDWHHRPLNDKEKNEDDPRSP